jgi:acetate kinase
MSKKASINPTNLCILTINGGSSSIKFALYQINSVLERGLYGQIDRIGRSDTRLIFKNATGKTHDSYSIDVADYRMAVFFLLDWLETRPEFASVQAVGHRVVHGMNYSQPQRITPELLDKLHRIMLFDPEHLPLEIALIESFRRRYPQLPQVACFDTAFHCSMPRIASLLPIPRRFDAQGIKRYGFHGLSYSYLMEELSRLGDSSVTTGNLILAHLGNGASLAAVQQGKCIDTSMGFTPSSGLPMSTRTGDLDPGVAWYLMQSENMTSQQFNKLINQESGLLGVSETSSDMRDLIKHMTTDVRAAEAVQLFCYQVKKWIGAYAAALGGLDTLVFSGGIGENAPIVRSRICDGLEFLGITIEEERNAAKADKISADTSRVAVRVMHTNEEVMIAKSVCQVLGVCRT